MKIEIKEEFIDTNEDGTFLFKNLKYDSNWNRLTGTVKKEGKGKKVEFFIYPFVNSHSFGMKLYTKEAHEDLYREIEHFYHGMREGTYAEENEHGEIIVENKYVLPNEETGWIMKKK